MNIEGAILALDPGTITGWAMYEHGHWFTGTYDLKPRRGDGAGMRFLRLWEKLDEFMLHHAISRVVYELPAGHYKSGAADDCIKGIVSHIQSWCERNKVPCEGYSPAEIKKFATGKGNAKKEIVFAAAQERWPTISDHNEADARWLLEMVLSMKEGAR